MTDEVDGVKCVMWAVKLEGGLERVDVCADAQTGVARMLTDNGEIDSDGTIGPLMSYAFTNMRILPDADSQDAASTDALLGGGLDESEFSLPSPWTHEACDRQVGGQPWLHLFHHYLTI